MPRLASILLFVAASLTAAPIRTLIFSGRNNHDWRSTTPHLRKLLTASGRFEVRVVEEPAGATEKTLAGYDLLVLDYNGARWGEPAEKAVEAFVRSGKGLVAVHAASYAFGGLRVLGENQTRTNIVEPPWREYAAMLGGSWSEAAPRTGHAPRHVFTVKFADREHPIARGMGEGFRIHDELYHSIRVRPSIKVIAAAYDDPKNGGTGKDEPMLWTVEYGRGRVFHTALGHDVAAMQEAGFAATFVRGAEWAATGEVTLPPREPARQAENPVRVEVVAGGHDHEASFYSLFEDQPDIRATVNPHPDAFSGDLVKRYDVLALYDMVQEIPEKQRRNLQTFAESGKGIVVLHHAIVSYNAWPWWSEVLVGGKYLLKPDGDRPASTYKHDEEILAVPVGKHPITDGIGTLRVVDEVYKGKWISPKITVLMKTDHPLDDGPLVWISPYEKSRVVYIELGHDRKAHEHPGYRRLVRRAILWAAGRLE